MKKKIIGIVIILLVIGAFLANHLITYARVATTPLYVNLTETDLKGIGYGIGNPNPTVGGTSNQGEYIWNIRNYDSEDPSTVSTKQRNLYCVKADYGTTWFDGEDEKEIIDYNLYYDMQLDREELLGVLKEDENFPDADDVVSALMDPSGNQYRQLLWLLDNSYVTGKTKLNDYLAQVGILSEENGGMTLYYNKETNTYYPEGEPLTEEDIIAIQRMAIWYFTNGQEDENGQINDTYNKTGATNTQWLYMTSDGGNSYDLLSSSRNAMAMDLYNYLIAQAKIGAEQYKDSNNYQINSTPANVNTSGLTQDSGKYVIQTTRKNANYLIGPVVINKNNELGYNIVISVTNQNNQPLTENVDYVYADKDGNSLNIESQKDLVGIENGFYVSVPRGKIENINIKVSISYETTLKKLWLRGTEIFDENGEAEEITLKGEQPIVEVTKDSYEEVIELISKPEEFDLALRKYITAVNGTNVTNTRVPNIDESTLLTETTATYKHRKDPVVVQDKDEVTYNITIYNEGNKAGYAETIIDQLPIGLVSSTNNSSIVVSKGPDGEERNQYKLQYSSSNNQIKLTLIKRQEELEQNTQYEEEGYVRDIQPYTANNLDYETIEIKCMVAKEPDTKKQIVLTNVAWIEAAFNSEDEIKILTKGQDRDSEPQTSPTLDNTDMDDYRGSTTGNELSDSGYFYKGQQDDDDFEKLVINPVVKKFDLALFKHIAAISKDQVIENGEYVTDNGNIDGTYLRAPVVKAIDQNTGKITYEQDDKVALTVEPGDYVLYTIRVYNEGEVSGYATKIKDTLPIGLEFVIENEQYNGIWKLEGVDADGRQIVATTWYAKGQGAELNAQKGDPNYNANLLKALNKEAAISDENPDYIDAQVLCKVVEQATSDRVLVNYAQISDDSDENGDEIDDIDSTPDEWIDKDDDQDIERIKLQCFDLSLRKFISSVNGKAPETLREPVVNVSNLVNKNATTAVYNHSKTPLAVKIGDKIIYTIRVYNEGDINGFASEVTDYLPPYLTYVKNSEINTKYGWQISENGRVVTTKYLANTELEAFNGTELNYADVKIECIVTESAPVKQNQTNIAEISEYTYNGGTVDMDIDSTSDNMVNKVPTDDNLPSYKNDEINKSYVPGNEDDDDFEKVYVKAFDLSLRKFISSVNGNTIQPSREPVVDVTPLKTGTGTTAIYNHSKAPVGVELKDTIIYTIRVYNEGEINGYASEVKDYLPPYLTYAENSETNTKYGWQISENGRVVTTKYLANTELEAFNGTELDYEDLKIECIVSGNTPIKENQTNIAEISEYKYGDTIHTEDVDSESDNIDKNMPKDEELSDYKKDKEKDAYVPGNEDDDDFEKIYVKEIDLSLRKFISSVNGNTIQPSREPVVDVTPLKNGTGTTAIYNHPKTPVALKVGDLIIYTIRVYNEGEAAGYANEVKDYLPPYLEYVENSAINSKYGWNISEDGRIATTTYLSNKEISAFNGDALDYEDIQIECRISEKAIPNQSITNIAEISEYKYGDTVITEDIDSESDNIDEKLPKDEELPDYKKDKEKDTYVPGNEDDDDFEKAYVKEFDLALRKFITKVQEDEVKTRVPQVKYENGVISYEHTKDTVTVHVGNIIIYTIRVYNEGEIDGYASEITDDIPEYLEYLPKDSTNMEYMWKMYDKNGNETEKVEEAVKVKTKYLSKENGEDKLIKAFDGKTVSYKDVKIAFKVKDPNSNTQIITNHAQISDDTDEQGNSIKDKDSEPDQWNNGEDDQDIENIKVEYFDLSLLKFVSKVIVIEDGKETITQTGHTGKENPEPVVKVELHKKKIKDVVVKFGYCITITNEGDIAGYATEITDYIPQGLKFDPTDNPEWTDEGNNVISTRQLENVLLQPGESKTVEVLLTWINGADNLSLKTNTAEISDDKNEYDIPDKDSTPDNKKDGEDDIDIAEVILAISTGKAKTYFTLILSLLAVIAVGVALIKKFVI